MDSIAFALSRPEVYVPLLIWSLFWKGVALWKSASKKHLLWFVILMVVNTLSILEIAYVFYLSRWDIDKGKTLNYLEGKFKRAK